MRALGCCSSMRGRGHSLAPRQISAPAGLRMRMRVPPSAAVLRDKQALSHDRTAAGMSATEEAEAWMHAWQHDQDDLTQRCSDGVMMHNEGMWLGHSVHGIKALRREAHHWASAIPDYQTTVLEAARSEPEPDGTSSSFVLWKGSGTNSVPQIPGVAATDKTFTHYGLGRHRKDRDGKVCDIFFFSGPTRDQAEHLLVDPHLPFDDDAWEAVPVFRPRSSGVPLTLERKAAMDASAAMMMRLLCGAPSAPVDVAAIKAHIASDVVFQEATRVWTSHGMHLMHGLPELLNRVRSMMETYQAVDNYPLVLSKAYTGDGCKMFLHSENVFHDLRSGVRHVSHALYLMDFADDDDAAGHARVSRVVSLRGPETEAEKAHFFDVLFCKGGHRAPATSGEPFDAAAEPEPKTAAVEASKAPAKKVVAKREAGGKKKKSKKSVETYKIYLYKVLKQVHPDTGVSSKAMSILNSMMNDMFDKVATEASRLSRYTKKPTITSREIQTAVRLVLPGELAKHAVSEGTKAVTKFTSA
ncbi:hypothetical protein FOA52_009344 [Chlamydomonas sp. UWO 241]|nr:hypothetical protein FOA52_009344 [Chlamydomonas sp. UWO 241]